MEMTKKKKNLYKYHIYNLGKKIKRKKKRKKNPEKLIPPGAGSDSREDKALHSVGATHHVIGLGVPRSAREQKGEENSGSTRRQE